MLSKSLIIIIEMIKTHGLNKETMNSWLKSDLISNTYYYKNLDFYNQ